MEIDEPDRRQEIGNDLRALEDRLAAWRPAAGALDRDRMLYDAGRCAARTESHIHAWRLATAALLVLLVGSGAFLTRQRSLLAQEQFLLAHERAQRLALEATLAAQTRSAPADILPVLEPGVAEPFAPSSYFVLASRQALDMADASRPGAYTPAVERGREPGLSNKPPPSAPLRPRNFARILDL